MRRKLWEIAFIVAKLTIVISVAPNIDYSNNMRVLLLPKSTKIGTTIYRLKGSDPDPDLLTFGVEGEEANNLLLIKSASFTEADVILKSQLEKEKYAFTLYVTDGKETTRTDASIVVTQAESVPSPFLDVPPIIVVPENTPANATIGFILAKEMDDSNLAVKFEIKGSDYFAIRYVFGPRGTSKAEILLVKPVDYERRNVFPLTILAMNAWKNDTIDTRNVAAASVVVVVSDVQDTPPQFTSIPLVVQLSESLKPGDLVFRVKAEDFDFGNPRNLTYQIVQNAQWTTFFRIDYMTGEVFLTRSVNLLREMFSDSMPILLTLKATEVGPSSGFSAMEVQADVAIVVVNTENHPPQFEAAVFRGTIPENSPLMTSVIWDEGTIPKVRDPDQGSNGTFQLYLDNVHGVFDVTPSKANGEVMFYIVVKDPTYLDYDVEEKEPIIIQLVAKELTTPQRFTATAQIRIKVTDVNDNIPQFSQAMYEASIPEIVRSGTSVITIKATDKDSGLYGDISYKLRGTMAKNFNIDSGSGVVTVLTDQGFDRERASEYVLTVEARDEKGLGTVNSTQLIIHLIDKNDNAPIFTQPRYDAVLQSDCKTFYDNLFIRAFDADETGDNSNVTYEIINGNYQEKFLINKQTGEIRLKEALTKTPSLNGIPGIPPITLTVRAHDQGIPVQYASVEVHIHGEEYLNRTINFIVPFKEKYVKDRIVAISKGLSEITGTPANILSVNKFNTSEENSLVEAWIAYPLTTTVNLTNIDYILSRMLGKDYRFEREEEVTNIHTTRYATVFWALIILVILIILAIIFCCCYFCCVKLIGNKLKKEMTRVSPQEKIVFIKDQDGHDSVKNAWDDDNETWVYSNGRLLKKHQHNFTPGVETTAKTMDSQRDARVSPRSMQIREPLRIDDRPVYAGATLRLDPQFEREGAQTVETEYVLQDGRRGEGRHAGGYIVVRRNVDDIRRRRSDRDDSERDHGYRDYPNQTRPKEPIRTEIMYIRSPPKESRYDRPYQEDEFLPRSVSETDLYNARQKVNREYDAEQRSHSLNANFPKQKPNVQPSSLRFSRHHNEPPYAGYRDSEAITNQQQPIQANVEHHRDPRWNGPHYQQAPGDNFTRGGRNLNVTNLGNIESTRVSPVAFDRMNNPQGNVSKSNLRIVPAAPTGQFVVGQNRGMSRDYNNEQVRDMNARNINRNARDYPGHRDFQRDYPLNGNYPGYPVNVNQNYPENFNIENRDYPMQLNPEYLTNPNPNSHSNPNISAPGRVLNQNDHRNYQSNENLRTYDNSIASRGVSPNVPREYHQKHGTNFEPVAEGDYHPVDQSNQQKAFNYPMDANNRSPKESNYPMDPNNQSPKEGNYPISPNIHSMKEGNYPLNLSHEYMKDGNYHTNQNKQSINDGNYPLNQNKTSLGDGNYPVNQNKTSLGDGNYPIHTGNYPVNQNIQSLNVIREHSSSSRENRNKSRNSLQERNEYNRTNLNPNEISRHPSPEILVVQTPINPELPVARSPIVRDQPSSLNPGVPSNGSTPKERFSTPLDHIEQYLVPINNGSRTSPIFDSGKIIGPNLCDESKLEKRAIIENRDGHVFIIETDQRTVENDITTNDDDSDSGIGGPYGSLKLKKGSYLEKKSVFTIAYDGMQTQKLKSREGRHISP